MVNLVVWANAPFETYSWNNLSKKSYSNYTLESWLDLSIYIASILPSRTEIFGPPHIETASAPAVAIKSAHDTNKHQ